MKKKKEIPKKEKEIPVIKKKSQKPSPEQTGSLVTEEELDQIPDEEEEETTPPYERPAEGEGP